MPTGGRGIANRTCLQDVYRGAIWTNASYIGCGENDKADIQDLAEVLNDKNYKSKENVFLWLSKEKNNEQKSSNSCKQ